MTIFLRLMALIFMSLSLIYEHMNGDIPKATLLVAWAAVAAVMAEWRDS